MSDQTTIQTETSIDTQGGPYIEGNATAAGDFVARDKIDGDQVAGDKIIGDKVIGDKVLGHKYVYNFPDNRPSPQELAQAREAYLEWLIDSNQYLESYRPVVLKLDEIYISLRAQFEEEPNRADRRLQQRELDELEERLRQSQLSAEEQEDQLDRLLYDFEQKRRLAESFKIDLESREEDCERSAPKPSPPIPLAQATAQHERLVILGDPGCGKTTLLRYLALQHAQAVQQGERHVHLVSDSADGTAVNNEQPAHFPILIRVADYAENYVKQAQSLSDFLPHYLQRKECKGAGMDDLLAHELAQGDCLVLLDGLDEIVQADDRRKIVNQIEEFVRSHAKGGQRGINRFIITSRIAGYRSAALSAVSGEPFIHSVVEEMNDHQIERFLVRWYGAVVGAKKLSSSEKIQFLDKDAQQQADNLLEAINDNPGARRLAGNPLMLHILASLHREQTALPKKRVELYKLAAETLAHDWRIVQGIPDEALTLIEDEYLTPLLSDLAYWMHTHKPTGIATEQEVYDQLGTSYCQLLDLPAWKPRRPNPKVKGQINKFLAAVREHTGLFVERAPKRYGFMHLTFEEYYVARYLADQEDRAQLIRQHLHDPRWEEPILLALGFVGLDYPEEAGKLLETAILAQSEEAEALGFTPSDYEELLGRDYLFALRCLGDQIPTHPKTMDRLTKRLADELIWQRGLARFQAYRQAVKE